MGLGRGETWGEINNSNDLPKKSFGNLPLQKLPKIYTCTYMKRVKVELPYNQIMVLDLIRSRTQLRSNSLSQPQEYPGCNRQPVSAALTSRPSRREANTFQKISHCLQVYFYECWLVVLELKFSNTPIQPFLLLYAFFSACSPAFGLLLV